MSSASYLHITRLFKLGKSFGEVRAEKKILLILC